MLTVLFTISLCLVLLLLGVKMFEVSKQHKTPIGNFLSKWDAPIERNMSLAQDVYEKKRQRANNFVREDLPKHSKETINSFMDSMWKKYHSVFPNVRGVRNLRTDRNASEFLQTISTHRTKDGKGWIEDTTVTLNSQPTINTTE